MCNPIGGIKLLKFRPLNLCTTEIPFLINNVGSLTDGTGQFDEQMIITELIEPENFTLDEKDSWCFEVSEIVDVEAAL